MKRYNTDVLVIGTGAAGMMAALEANEKGAKVLTVGKGAVGKGTCTSLAGGIFGSSTREFSPEEYRLATVESGRGLNDPRLVDLVINGSRELLEKLKGMGAPFLEFPRGYNVDNSGNRKDVPGIVIVESMRKMLNERGVESLTGFHCLELLKEEERAAGVLGMTTDGEPAAICAPTVILATGGAGAIYQRHDNPGGITGEGYAMALRAGVRLQDMEFVQFYPVGIAEPGLPPFIIFPPYPPETKVCGADGRNVFEELEGCEDLMQAIIHFRDTASLLFYQKHVNGGLFLDLTEVPEESWRTLHSMRLLARFNFDFRNRSFRIAPITHFFIGGLVVNTEMETSLPGLFAAGEVAGGFHGANRMGGNALTECIVCGSVAGARAAEHAADAGKTEPAPSNIDALIPSWAGEKESGFRKAYPDLFNAVKKTAWEQAGVIRNKEGMQKGLSLVSRLEGELESLTPRCVAEGLRHNQACSALLVLRSVLESALRREESRGAHYREDFPEIDDANWRKNILISLDSSTNSLILEEQPIND